MSERIDRQHRIIGGTTYVRHHPPDDPLYLEREHWMTGADWEAYKQLFFQRFPRARLMFDPDSPEDAWPDTFPA